MRILAADDDRDLLDAVACALERAGHTVLRASNGAELVEHLAERGRFDLLITDIRMPWMNGLQAAVAARNAGMQMPILVISGVDDARVVDQVRTLGRSELMRKPFGLAELERTVERLFGLRGMTLSTLDATAQAALVRNGEVTPTELVDAAIARIELHDGELNSVIMRRFDQARAETKAIDRTAPFAGVPIVVKDIIAQVEGMPYTAGTRMLKAAGTRSRHDSYLVASLRKAGFVIVGKTASSELGILPSGETAAWGVTKNPWDPTRSTGGSSAGTGAAVAAGLVPIGHGNDGGGSIRIPSSCNGLVGLKPSRGRNSLGPDLGEINGGLVCEHVLARSVRDSAAVLDLVHGYRPGNPYSAPSPERPFLEEVGAPVRGLRIGFCTRFLTPMGTFADSHPDCIAAVERAASLLADLGHHVEPAEHKALQHKEYVARFLAVWACGVAIDLENIAAMTGKPVTPEEVEPLTWALAQMGRQVSGTAYALGWQFLRTRARELAAWWDTHDLWLTPTITQPPLPLGALASTAADPMGAIFKAAELAPFTAPFNATGQPAISLPLHIAGGLPIGVQLVAGYGREDLLLRVAAQLEDAVGGWQHKATRPDFDQ